LAIERYLDIREFYTAQIDQRCGDVDVSGWGIDSCAGFDAVPPDVAGDADATLVHGSLAVSQPGIVSHSTRTVVGHENHDRVIGQLLVFECLQ